MINIPYGISNFRRLIEDGFYYVDRTTHIPILERTADYIFYLRPRRFGKSLLVSMLHYYYGLEYADQFQQLFGNLYIGKHPTPKANKYLVLSFEFSRINTDTAESTFYGFLSNVKSGVSRFCKVYDDYFDDEEVRSILSEPSPNEVLKKLFDVFSQKEVPYPIYILIDEYDHFANELISFHFDVFVNAVSRNGFVRKFYESIKTASRDGAVEKLFVTGVSPITLDSLTSGFNIGTHATLSVELHSMMGFHEEEVVDILRGIEIPENELEQTMYDLRSWYNGYLFSPEADKRVYNSDMVLYFAREYKGRRKYPRTLLDVNIASDYGKIKNIFKIQKREAENYEVLRQLNENGFYYTALTEQFSFEKGFTQSDLASLLFYMGFLTIKRAKLNGLELAFPNFVIEKLYADYFVAVLQEQSKLPIDNAPLNNALTSLAEVGSPELIIKEVQKIFDGLSNRDSRWFNEVSFKSAFVALLFQQGFYYVHSEFETAKTYADVFLQGIRPFEPTYECLFELKFLKKEEESLLRTVMDDAKIQLRGYMATPKFKVNVQLKAFVVVCVNGKLYCEETFL